MSDAKKGRKRRRPRLLPDILVAYYLKSIEIFQNNFSGIWNCHACGHQYLMKFEEVNSWPEAFVFLFAYVDASDHIKIAVVCDGCHVKYAKTGLGTLFATKWRVNIRQIIDTPGRLQ
jgi:hypothetical protein